MLGSGGSARDQSLSAQYRMAEFFDDPYKPLMPIQPLIRAHPERLTNEGDIESLFIYVAAFSTYSCFIRSQFHSLLFLMPL